MCYRTLFALCLRALALSATLLACSHAEVAGSSDVPEVSASSGSEQPRERTLRGAGPVDADTDLVDRVDVGGYSLFVACEGKGRPTVVMESGFDDAGIVWGRKVIRGVARVSRVCVYDRAGLGYSDPRPDRTDSGKISADLHALLQGAGIAPPYVLVAHSIGGIHARVFDHQHPDEVLGMVLVDSSHPDQFVRAKDRLGAQDWQTMWRQVETSQADPDKEPIDWERSRELAIAAGPFGDRPLRVLSHDPSVMQPCAGDGCLSAEGNAAWESLWSELQTELTALSPTGTWLVVAGSGHYIQDRAPEAVVDAVTQVVAAVR
jgi:pimeloyl-ACP methyl ester carboxylesterase